MDLQFFGANCVSLAYKNSRIVVDDNLVELGGKPALKADDIALFSSAIAKERTTPVAAHMMLDGPGEYEVADISIIGIPARAHMDEVGAKTATMFKLIIGDVSVLITGHVYPELSDEQLEAIGRVDVMIVPVGGNGYTVDPIGAVKLIKEVEPKLVIPTHYADKALNFPVPQQELSNALKELGMEPKETVSKLRVKSSELGEITHLIVLEKS